MLTSGGDAPGMNAAIRSVVRAAYKRGWETVGFRRGFSGLIDRHTEPLAPRLVANIIQRGGSILDTSREPRCLEPGWRRQAIEALDAESCRGLIVIGGNGSQAGAASLQEKWDGPVVGIPSTIDNDLGGTDRSIGFDTACNTALEAIDRIRDTANSLDRLFFVEVMGRGAGFIGLEVAVGGGAEAVVLPERPVDCRALSDVIQTNYAKGKKACIIVVAEGAHPGGARGLLQEMHEQGLPLASEPGAVPRVTILGHIQRGGNPTVIDRVLASRFGIAAVEAVVAEHRGVIVGIRGDSIVETDRVRALKESRVIENDLLELVNTLAG